MEIRFGFISIGLTVLGIILALFGYRNAIKQLEKASTALELQLRQDRIKSLQDNHNLILHVRSKLTIWNTILIEIRKDYDAIIFKGKRHDEDGKEVKLSFGGKSILTNKKLINGYMYEKMENRLQQYYICGARHYYSACSSAKVITRKSDDYTKLDIDRINQIDESDALDINNPSLYIKEMISDLDKSLPERLTECPASDNDDEYIDTNV